MFDIFGSFGALWIVIALGLFGAGGVTTNAVDEGKIPVMNLFGSRQEAEEPGKANEEITFEDVPWGQFANSDPIKALAFVHFVGNWGTYVVLAWLPTYFTEEVGFIFDKRIVVDFVTTRSEYRSWNISWTYRG